MTVSDDFLFHVICAIFHADWAIFLTVYAETLFFLILPRKLTRTQLEKLVDAADAAPRLPAFLLLALLHPAPLAFPSSNLPTSSLLYF